MKLQLLPVATLLNLAASQASIPSDLSSGFGSTSLGLQLSFGGDASEGLATGAVVSLEDASEAPTFALTDSSGVNTALSFLIMMIDTTDENNRALHFLQTGFQPSGTKTKLESSDQPAFPYQAPGPNGEEGGAREYTFLLYLLRGENDVSDIPSSGDTFDVKSFEDSNDLSKPRAGLAISVDMAGGSGGGGGGGGGNGEDEPPQEPTSTPTPTSTDAVETPSPPSISFSSSSPSITQSPPASSGSTPLSTPTLSSSSTLTRSPETGSGAPPETKTSVVVVAPPSPTDQSATPSESAELASDSGAGRVGFGFAKGPVTGVLLMLLWAGWIEM